MSSSSGGQPDIARFNEGDIIFSEGDSSEFLYIIKKGRVRIVKDAGERIIPITIINEKEFLGEMAIFSDGPRSASAIALESTELVKIKKEDILKQMALCAEWVTNIMSTIAQRLISVDEIIREHKIVDERLCAGNALTPKEENKIKEALALKKGEAST